MRLETTRFGTIEADENTIITFTQPIIGFQEYRRFVLVPGPPDSNVTWLQSVDAADLAFLLMRPRQIVPEYKVDLPDHELAELAVSSVDELDVYTLVVVPSDTTKIRTNLRAPVMINAKHKLGKQTVLEKSDYPIQCFLSSGAQQPEEVTNARADAQTK